MPANPKFWFRSLIIAALGAGLLGVLGACSALRIGYGQAPDLLYWYLDGYVDFNDNQTPKVREALAQFMAWHRRTQLPDYANQLVRAQAEVLADTSAARVCEWQAELLTRANAAFDRAVPAAAEFLLTVTPQQVQYLERHQAKQNVEFREDYLQPEPRKRNEVTLKRTLERAESLYGKLTDSQRARIAEGLLRSPFDPEAWFAERRQRQQDALSLMRRWGVDAAGRPAGAREQAGSEMLPVQVQAALRAYVQGMAGSPREPYRRYTERLNEFNCSFAAALHNTTSVAQRRAAAQKLAGWEGDVRVLAVDLTRASAPDAMLR